MSSLRKKATVSIFWSLLEQVVRQGSQFLVIIILARLLSPADFGLVAMITIFTAFASAFIDSGFSAALIQKKILDPDDADTVFYFNAAMGALMTVMLYAAAPAIAVFYNQPVLKPMTQLISLTLFIGALGGIHTALLARSMDFKIPMRISLVTSFIAGFSSVAAAFSGWGAWSLVLQMGVSVTLSTLLLWRWHVWRPRLVFNWHALGSLSRYGSNLLLSELFGVAASKLNALAIGKFYSATDLGFYNRADSTQQIPQTFISKIFNRVAFPAFSAAAGSDREQFHRAGIKVLDFLTLLIVPLMVGIMCAAPTLITVVFGVKWLPCVPYLPPLCLVGIFWPFLAVNMNMLKARGDSSFFLKMNILYKGLFLLALFLSCRISVLAMAWAQLPVAIAFSLIIAIYVSPRVGLPIKAQCLVLMPHVVCGIAIGIVVIVLEKLWHPEMLILKLAVEIIATGAVCLAIAAAFRVPALDEIKQLRQFKK